MSKAIVEEINANVEMNDMLQCRSRVDPAELCCLTAWPLAIQLRRLATSPMADSVPHD